MSDSLGIRHSDLVEPQATYHILRLKKDILNNSSIGFIATHAARSTERPATTCGPNYSRSRGVSRWVANVDDPANAGQQIPVFGELDTDNFSLVTRANVTFTKELSFQLYNQIFFAAGDYQNFKSLTSPRTFGVLPAGLYTDNPDFNNRSMNINVVFRWEYRPGSTLFVVWSQARSGGGIPGDASFGRNFRGVFDAPADNVVLMKLNYWWNL